MAPPTLSYGLNLANKKASGKPALKNQAGQKRKKTIFDSDSDEDDNKPQDDGSGGAVEIETLGGLSPPGPSSGPSDEPTSKRQRPSDKKQNPPAPSLSSTSFPGTKKDKSGNNNNYINLSSLHASNKHAQDAAAIDPTIYDYDAIYDSIHPRKSQSTASGAANNGDPDSSSSQGPKYINSLLNSAEVRKRDQLRARDKLLAREREAEGDEFADKEKFVTGAYKEQQEEVRRIEAEEAEREKEEEEKRKKGLGMTSFYKDVLERDGRRHEEAMKAAEEAAERKRKMGHAELEAESGAPPQEKSAAEIAAERNAGGARIVVNDEGEVVDKRQLLSAGLNVTAKPKPKPAPGAERAAPRVGAGRPSAAGGAASVGNAQRARQTEMLATQLEERMQKEKEEEETRMKELAEKNKSKKTDKDVSSAKERYLARKREREMEKAQGK